MPSDRFSVLCDELNLLINRTVSRAGLQALRGPPGSSNAVITHLAQERHRRPSSIPLRNGFSLMIRLRVHLDVQDVVTDSFSLSYQRSPDPYSPDWIFRYDQEPAQIRADGYPYAPAHLHVNATPAAYVGPKPFPDLHLPTGRLSLVEIVRHLIVEHDVPTIGDRSEALAFLDGLSAESL